MYDASKYKPVYTRESKTYDCQRYEGNYGRLQLQGIYRSLDTFVEISENTRVLDVATGTGVVSLYLATKGGKIVALDLTEAMIREAKRKSELANLNNVSFHIGSAFDLPYKDASFDIVTSNKFFHLIPYELQGQLIKEFFRVLKPGGYLIVEFKNILYGGLIRLVLKFLLQTQEGYCIWPFFTKRLFKGQKIVGMIGYYFPSQHRFPQGEFVQKILIKGGYIFPFKWFYDKLCIKCQKR